MLVSPIVVHFSEFSSFQSAGSMQLMIPSRICSFIRFLNRFTHSLCSRHGRTQKLVELMCLKILHFQNLIIDSTSLNSRSMCPECSSLLCLPPWLYPKTCNFPSTCGIPVCHRHVHGGLWVITRGCQAASSKPSCKRPTPEFSPASRSSSGLAALLTRLPRSYLQCLLCSEVVSPSRP